VQRRRPRRDFNERSPTRRRRWGGVDVWICNAGISPVVGGPLRDRPAVWREVLDVNLTGAFLGARAARASWATAGG
jgi:NAD(P)-dependent dehydrogenase (short-subunit alcohol dehydrogenase family)